MSAQRLRVSLGGLIRVDLTAHSCGYCWQNSAWPIGCDVRPRVSMWLLFAAIALVAEANEIAKVKAKVVLLFFSMCITPRNDEECDT